MNEPKTYRDGIKPTITSRVRAKKLRRQLTPPECRLWIRLKSKQLNGLRFRKQVAIGLFIADFYCHEARLVLEVDGRSHQGEQLQHDQSRDHWMGQRDICVLRFQASEIGDNLDGVLSTIASRATQLIEDREAYRREAQDPLRHASRATSPGSPGEETGRN